MATERTSRSGFVEAVADARRIRGSINLEPADSRRWSAVDGALELRVAEPPRRLLRRGASDERRWLEAHGFSKAVDCWVLPLAASVSEEEAAERWHVERSPAGCQAGAADLLRRVEAEWPDARSLPLFLHLLAPHG